MYILVNEIWFLKFLLRRTSNQTDWYNKIYLSGNLSFKFQGVKFEWNYDQDYIFEVTIAEDYQHR